MKKICYAFLATCMLGLWEVNGQTAAASSATQPSPSRIISQNLVNTPYVLKMKDFKTELEAFMKQMFTTVYLDPVQSEQLETLYKDVRYQYNKCLNLIKADGLDSRTLAGMLAARDAHARTYEQAYTAFGESYQNRFLPFYQNLTAMNPKRPSPPAWEAMSREIFYQPVDILPKAQLSKESRQGVLSNLNEYFLNPHALRTWQELRTESLATQKAPAPTVLASTLALQIEEPGTQSGEADALSTKTESPTNKIDLPYPTMKQMKGTLGVKLKIGEAPAQALSFTATGFTDQNPVASFKAQHSVSPNAALQFNLKHAAYTYLLAYGEKGLKLIYPYSAALVSQYKMSKEVNLPSGPLMLQNADNQTQIPAQNTENGSDNFLPLGVEGWDGFVLLLSRTELNPTELMNLLEGAQGDMADRLNSLFGNQLLTPQTGSVKLDETGTIQFEDMRQTKPVLALQILMK